MGPILKTKLIAKIYPSLTLSNLIGCSIFYQSESLKPAYYKFMQKICFLEERALLCFFANSGQGRFNDQAAFRFISEIF